MKKSKKKETLSKKGTQAQNLTTAERIVGRHCCQFEYAKWQKGGGRKHGQKWSAA